MLRSDGSELVGGDGRTEDIGEVALLDDRLGDPSPLRGRLQVEPDNRLGCGLASLRREALSELLHADLGIEREDLTRSLDLRQRSRDPLESIEAETPQLDGVSTGGLGGGHQSIAPRAVDALLHDGDVVDGNLHDAYLHALVGGRDCPLLFSHEIRLAERSQWSVAHLYTGNAASGWDEPLLL
jgi:hypothetical protein